ncbi:hypothetical protein GQS78_06090 [Thermococcus bergensis]|uniref:hypothetical protein n=1 Tax=Thermococcus bergensis TaxID=2689387 RepID=UPI001CEC46E4|nr:hypothetical protein [Thermococcus bergensis]MCA6213825.1 hypothetical protein [Thermococcus bergensis]
MSFSFIFFGFEEALRGEVSADTLTIAIKHGDEIMPLGDCFTKDAVGDIIEAIAFAVNSCEGVKELYIRSGKCDVLLFPGRYCRDNSITLRLGTYEPISYIIFKINGDLIQLKIRREDRKDVTTVEVPREKFVPSAISFVRSFLVKFPDEDLMRELRIVEEMASRKGFLPTEKKFEIKVEWLGEVKCRNKKFPLVYAIISHGKEIFSGLVEPVAFAGSLLEVLRSIRGLENRCQVEITLYEDVIRRASSLLGEESLEYFGPCFGNEWPGLLFIFKKNREMAFVNVKTGSVVRASMEEVEDEVVRAVKEVVEKLEERGEGHWLRKELEEILR